MMTSILSLPKTWRIILLCSIAAFTTVDAFSSSPQMRQQYRQLRRHAVSNSQEPGDKEEHLSLSEHDAGVLAFPTRRVWVASAVATSMGLGLSATSAMEAGEEEGVRVYQLPSGLKYIELEGGRESSSTPRYGQLCIISYKAYLKLPTAKEKEQFDSSGAFIVKHGNGRMIAGLDEGLHTMKVGGLRRIIIPPKLGFVDSGLGPLPQYPWNRMKLNSLLDKMVEQRGGNLVYDVRLEKVIDDEADQGYYDDFELSPEQLEEIQNRLNKRKT